MSKFGIGQDVKSTNKIDFEAGIHNAVYLTNVSIKKTGKEGNVKDNLCFSFKSTLAKDVRPREIDILEFQIDETDEKFDKKIDAFNTRIKHIWEAFGKFPEGGIQPTVHEGRESTFLDFLNDIVNIFNKNTGTPESPSNFYHGKPVNIKLVWSLSDFLGFPYGPNFIEDAKTKPTTLVWNSKYDKAKPNKKEEGNKDPFGGAGNDMPFA